MERMVNPVKPVERYPALDTQIVVAARQSPDWWIKTVLGANLWAMQKEIARSVFLNRRTVVPSCEGSGKTYVAGRIALAFLINFKPSTVITTAPSDRQVTQILWREIATAHANARIPLPGTVLTKQLDIEDDWFALGFSTDQQERFQGFHNENVLVIVDEASGVSDLVYQALENPLATGNTHLLLIGNPTQPVGKFRDAVTSKLYHQINISAFDTPNFTHWGITLDDIRAGTWEGKIKGEMPCPFLVTPARAAERLEDWGEGSYLFQTFVMGRFPDAGVNNLIPLHLIEQAMSRQPTPDDMAGVKICALDVSRYGDDETVFGTKIGKVIRPLITWGHQDTMYTAGRTARHTKEIKPAITRVDSVGVGGGVVDRLKEVGVKVAPINVGEKAVDSEKFLNKRAEAYFHLLKLLEDGEVILPNDPKLKSQLADIRYKYTSRSQMQIETKEEMKSRGSKSPDLADTIMMLCLPTRALARKAQVWRY